MTTAAADVRWAVKVMISRPLVFFFFGCRSSPSILHFRRKNEFLSSFCVTCCFFSSVSSSSSFLRQNKFSVPKLWLYRFPQGIRFHVACVFTLWKWVTSRWAIRAQHSRKYRSPVVSFTMLTFFFFFFETIFIAIKAIKVYYYYIFYSFLKKKRRRTIHYRIWWNVPVT